MSSPSIVLHHVVPDVATYRALRRAAGMTDRAPEAAGIGLAASLFSVLAYRDVEAVGMARIIGDGGCFFQICDVAVISACQRQGIGHRLMQAITDWIDDHAPPSAFVSLIADDASHHLYRHHGFVPSAPNAIGMTYPRYR